MAKQPRPDVASLGVREHMLLFCGGSGTDWQRAGVTGDTITAMVVRGLIVRDGRGRLVLTDDGAGAVARGCDELAWARRQACPTLFPCDAPASFTPSARAFCRVAVSVRLSLRATMLVFVFSRTSVFSMLMSSFVQGRGFFVVAFSFSILGHSLFLSALHFARGRLAAVAAISTARRIASARDGRSSCVRRHSSSVRRNAVDTRI